MSARKHDLANPGWLKGKLFPPLKANVLERLLTKGKESARELSKATAKQFRLSGEDAGTVLR